MKNFQIVLLGLFGFFIIAGVITFATFRGGGGEERLEQLDIWGTVDQGSFQSVVVSLNRDRDEKLQLSYKQLREEEFDQKLIEALASGLGPDMVLLSQDRIVRHADKILLIPFESFPERDFKDRFIEEGELYLTPLGIVGLPFSVDPLVMYWNRTLFANAGLARPPQFWDEMFSVSKAITKKDERGNILKSGVALGTFNNIKNAKEILVTMMLQAGTPITTMRGEKLDAVLKDQLGLPVPPAEASVRFYTEFADSAKSIHSWDRSLPSSEQAFLAGDVAIYFGFASELFSLRDKNPNLNFDVAPLPQVSTSERDTTFGRMQALSVLKGSSKLDSAFQVLGVLTGEESLALWEEETGLPPVRRDMLAKELDASADAFRTTFRRGALVSRAFLDPDRDGTKLIFQDMVEGVISGRSGLISDAVNSAHQRLEALIEERS